MTPCGDAFTVADMEQLIDVSLDRGQPQLKPVVLTFENRDRLGFTSGLQAALFENGAARMRIKDAWSAAIVLPRVNVAAEALPIMKLRMATEKTKKIVLRFATCQEPTLSDRVQIPLTITPDGQIHDYSFDLGAVAAGKWSGDVYYVRMEPGEGREEGEVITLERVSFEPRD